MLPLLLPPVLAAAEDELGAVFDETGVVEAVEFARTPISVPKLGQNENPKTLDSAAGS